MRWGARTARAGVSLLVLAVVALGAPVSAAAQAPAKTYDDAAYTPDYPLPPTRAESQHKLWFHADSWWALLLEPTGRTARVFQLMPDHTWRPTSAVVNSDTGGVGDAVQDGETVHVVTRASSGPLYYVNLTFDATAGEYRAGPSRLITNRSAVAPAMIAKDTAGVLWVAYATTTNVVVTHSFDGGQTWGRMLVLATTGTGDTQEAAALVAYDDRVGILWSDQGASAFYFASHRAGDDPLLWSREQALAGSAVADNHISLTRVPGEPSDTLVAAVKTSFGDQGEASTSPLIQVLVRGPDGRWSAAPAGRVADGLDDPVLQVDQATRTVHLFASRNGAIVSKDASWDDIRFAPGTGSVFMNGVGGTLVDPAVTADPVDARSGLVVLASDSRTKSYRNAEMPLAAPAPVAPSPDTTAPNPPTNVQARAVSPQTAVVSWSPATDGARWVPAATGVPVSRYVVLRNGSEVGTVTSTSFEDRVRTADEARKPASVEYQVVAVDDAGNRSAAARVVVELPGPRENPFLALIGLGLLVLAALAGGYGLWRTWAGHRMAARDELAGRDGQGGSPLSWTSGATGASPELAPHR